jgi:hypothetical protein
MPDANQYLIDIQDLSAYISHVKKRWKQLFTYNYCLFSFHEKRSCIILMLKIAEKAKFVYSLLE